MDHRLYTSGRARSSQEKVGVTVLAVSAEDHACFRYFFHATLASQESNDYHQLDDDEDQEMTDGTVEDQASLKIPTTPEGFEPKLEETEDINTELADWFQVDPKPAVPEDSETEDESDADSNNDDVKEEDADADEWFQVPEVPRSPAVKPLDDNVRDLKDDVAVIH